MGLLEDDLRAPDVGDERLEGPLDDELDPDRRREMEDDVCPGDQVVDEVGVDDGPHDELEPRVADMVPDVVVAAGGEVVEGDHRVPAGKESVPEV